MQERHDITAIKAGNEKAFEKVFKEYYGPLLNLARGILRSELLAEEQVQEIFVKLWEGRDSLRDDLKLLPYLLTSVRNKCYNQARRMQVEQKYVDLVQNEYREQILNYDYEEVDEKMIARIHQSIALMPDKCREVFYLSRFEGLNHKQIAEKLGISTKTVENHITKAMKKLKADLGSVVIFFIFLIGDF